MRCHDDFEDDDEVEEEAKSCSDTRGIKGSEREGEGNLLGPVGLEGSQDGRCL